MLIFPHCLEYPDHSSCSLLSSLQVLGRISPTAFYVFEDPLCVLIPTSMRQHGDASGVSHGKCRIEVVGCVPTLTSLGRCRMLRGLEMLGRMGVVLFQVFTTRPEVVTTHLFWGTVQN